METIVVSVSGVSDGNPGPAGFGVVINKSDGSLLQLVSESIGNAGAEFATYYGVSVAMQTLERNFGDLTKSMQFEFRLDNELVKKQLNSEVEITQPGLVPFFIQSHNQRVIGFPNIVFTYRSLAQNKEAYQLAKAASLVK